jgi:DNA-directed RNA polymerase subunit RPC12/RpoP
MTTEIAFDLAYCDDCNEKVEPPVKVYSCPDCGDLFTSDETDSGTGNRAPCCGKFGALDTLYGCPECKKELDLYTQLGPGVC